jgi:hypothetical protein
VEEVVSGGRELLERVEVGRGACRASSILLLCFSSVHYASTLVIKRRFRDDE